MRALATQNNIEAETRLDILLGKGTHFSSTLVVERVGVLILETYIHPTQNSSTS